LPLIEKIKSDEIKCVQNLIVVDKAIPADKKDKPKRSIIIAGGAVGSFVIAVLYVFLINYLSELKQEFKILDGKFQK
jgi:uncharacterized protein involved in exopolysaccharide biosynthesis